MKKNITILFTVLLGFFGSVQLHSSVQALEQNSSIAIEVFDQYSSSKDKVIKDLLDLQRSLIIPLQLPIPEENAKNGFILIKMSPEYVNGLLEEKDGLIVAAYQDQCLVGYILLIEIGEFKELYQDESYGFIETSMDLELLERLLSQSKVGYVEQIAVKPGHSKRGIGTQLINASMKLKPDGLVADVFLEPLTNEASLQFFSRQGFEKLGVLHQYPRKNFPHAHRTQVFFLGQRFFIM